jgi:hypothetical protein
MLPFAAAGAAAGGNPVDKLEALVEAMFSWGAIGWATAVLYGVFLLS